MVRTETPPPALANRDFSLPRLCRPSRIKPEGEPWPGACSLGQDIAGPGRRKPFDPPACHRSLFRSGLRCEARPFGEASALLDANALFNPFGSPCQGGRALSNPFGSPHQGGRALSPLPIGKHASGAIQARQAGSTAPSMRPARGTGGRSPRPPRADRRGRAAALRRLRRPARRPGRPSPGSLRRPAGRPGRPSRPGSLRRPARRPGRPSRRGPWSRRSRPSGYRYPWRRSALRGRPRPRRP
jgi:hypothetical protein